MSEALSGQSLTTRAPFDPKRTLGRCLNRRRLASWALYLAAGTFAFERITLYPRLSLSDAALLAATVLLLPTLRGAGASVLRWVRPLLIGIALIAAGGLLGTLAAPSILGSLAGLVAFVLLTSWLILLIATWQPDSAEIRRIVWCFLGSVAASSLYAIFLDQGDLNGRSLGLTTHPNQLAMLCILATGSVTMLVAGSRGWQRAVAVAVAAIVPLGLLFSGSRAGFFGYLAVLLGVVILSQRRSWVLAALAGPLIAAVIVTTGIVHLPTPNALQRVFAIHDPRVQNSLDYSNLERRELLSVTLSKIENHPLTGEGFQYFSAAHDIYLQLWASAGLLGVAGCALIIWQVLTPVRESWRDSSLADRDSPEALLALGLSLGFGGFLVAGLFQNALSDRYIWLAPALVLTLRPMLAAAEERQLGGAAQALWSPPSQ